LFVVTAVESLNDQILEKLQKGHTRADFVGVVELFRKAGLALQPTFVPFTPWTTFDNYLDLLTQIRGLNLIESIAPIQLAIRLLIPPGSRILELEDVQRIVGPFDSSALVYPWQNPNPGLDEFAAQLLEIVAVSEKLKKSRAATFESTWRAANLAAGRAISEIPVPLPALPATVPYLNEPWYC
jgi:hypothetical protein